MKKSRLFILLSIIVIICVFAAAASCNFCGVPVKVGDEEATEIESGPSESENNNDIDNSNSDDIETNESSDSSDTSNNNDEDNEQDQQVQETPGEDNNDQQQDDLDQEDNQDQQVEQEEEVEEQATLKEGNVPLVGSETGYFGMNLETNEVWNFDNRRVDIGYACDYYIESSSGKQVPVHGLMNGFISFDISSLSGAEIQDAVLYLSNCEIEGDPSYFNKMYINIINWGAGPPPKSMYDAEGTVVQGYPVSSGGNIQCSSSVLKDGLQQAINSGSQRFQLRLLFSGTWKLKQIDDEDSWSYQKENIRLTVRYLQ